MISTLYCPHDGVTLANYALATARWQQIVIVKTAFKSTQGFGYRSFKFVYCIKKFGSFLHLFLSLSSNTILRMRMREVVVNIKTEPHSKL